MKWTNQKAAFTGDKYTFQHTTHNCLAALSPALHVVCGTRFLSVSGILLEKMFISRRNLIRSCPSTRIYLDVVGLDTDMTEMVANQTLYASITKNLEIRYIIDNITRV